MAEVRSGSFVTSGYSDSLSPDHYVFSWTLSSQSIVDNTSTITWSVVAAGGSTAGYYNTVTQKYVTVYGATKSNSTPQTSYNGTTPFSGTTVIKHDANGKGSFSASCGGAFEFAGAYNSTGSGSWDLPTIQRATTPVLAATTITMGSSTNITLTPANSTFKHKLRYDFGGTKESATGFSIGAEYTAQGNTTVTFTPPTTLGSQIPNNLSGTGRIICHTYTSSGTHIGTTYVAITLNVPSYTPSVTGITLTGNSLLSGAYVQGKSTVTVNATVATSYGANLKSITSVVDGKSYSGLPFTTSTLSSGSLTVKITIVDTRDKSVTIESSAIQVYFYATPNITQFTLDRQSNGTTVIATIKGSISAINNKNAKTIKVTLNGVTNTVTSSTYSINTTTTFTNVPTDSTLTAKAVFTDSYTSVERTATLPTVAVTMDFYKDGTGIAMGKVAEGGTLLDVAWNERVRKNLQVDGTINGLTINYDTYIKGGSSEGVSSENWVGNSSSFIGTYSQNDAWYNTISVRHRNGNGDGVSYGMQLRSSLTSEDNLSWRQQYNGNWKDWRTLLDTKNTVDYVIEQGTYSDGWEYTKWKNGRIELWADKSITFPDPTNMGNYLWRSIYSLDMSSKLKSIIGGTCCVQYSGMLPTFSRHSTILTMGEIVVATSKSFTGFTTIVPIYIIGKWK